MKRERKSIGFADLSNFAVLIDKIGEEKGIALLQNAYEFAGDIILENGGTIHKYLGDAILFSFPDPQQATKAAHQIAEKHWPIEDTDLFFYVGVATGEVLIGTIGHPSYMVEDILGTAVNQASIQLDKAKNSNNHVSMCKETQKFA